MQGSFADIQGSFADIQGSYVRDVVRHASHCRLRIYRALWRIFRVLLRIYRALWRICRAVLRMYHPVDIQGFFAEIFVDLQDCDNTGFFGIYIGLF